MKFIQFLLSLIFLVIVGVVLYLGYLGFIPVLSSFMGADKPKDLGVRYTKKEYDTYIQKAQTEVIPVREVKSPAESIVYSGKKDLKQSFTQDEISARLNYAMWKYMPVANTQVRINSNGTVEFSGNVLMDRLPGFIQREGMGQYTMADVQKGLNYIKLLKVNPPVYVRFNGSVADNNLALSIQQIQVGKFNVPLDVVHANETATSVYNSIVSKVSSLSVKSVTFSDSQMHFDGTVPEKMMVETAE